MREKEVQAISVRQFQAFSVGQFRHWAWPKCFTPCLPPFWTLVQIILHTGALFQMVVSPYGPCFLKPTNQLPPHLQASITAPWLVDVVSSAHFIHCWLSVAFSSVRRNAPWLTRCMLGHICRLWSTCTFVRLAERFVQGQLQSTLYDRETF